MQIRHWLMLMIFIPAIANADFIDSYQAGVAAFREGKYEEALMYFNRAENQGINTPNLHYNLGATFYKTKRYDQAEKRFQKLTDLPEWKPLAFYNLGLIAEVRGNRDAAMDYYFKTYHSAGPSRIKQLAARKLDELEPALTDDDVVRNWYGLLSTSIGYDDNAVMMPDDALAVRGKTSDFFTDLYGFGGRYLQRAGDDRLRIDAGLYARLYAEESEFTYGSLFAGITRDKQYNTWNSRLGLWVNADFIEDQFYAATPTIRLVFHRRFEELNLSLANSLSWVEAEKKYEYLTGVRNRVSAELGSRLYAAVVHAGYEAEYNNRRDLQTDSDFFSYSPIRHKIYAGLDYAVTQNWTVNVRGEFRRSLYPDADTRLNQDGSVIRNKREDDRLVAAFRGEYKITAKTNIFAEYHHTDNDSNVFNYTYTSNQILVGVQKAF
jgi:tetratricopeptide (TPR) repeat protein